MRPGVWEHGTAEVWKWLGRGKETQRQEKGAKKFAPIWAWTRLTYHAPEVKQVEQTLLSLIWVLRSSGIKAQDLGPAFQASALSVGPHQTAHSSVHWLCTYPPGASAQQETSSLSIPISSYYPQLLPLQRITGSYEFYLPKRLLNLSISFSLYCYHPHLSPINIHLNECNSLPSSTLIPVQSVLCSLTAASVIFYKGQIS